MLHLNYLKKKIGCCIQSHRPTGQHMLHPEPMSTRVVIVVVDDDHEIIIATTLVLCDLDAVVHGDRYVANSDIRLRSRNLYLQVVINS